MFQKSDIEEKIQKKKIRFSMNNIDYFYRFCNHMYSAIANKKIKAYPPSKNIKVLMKNQPKEKVNVI